MFFLQLHFHIQMLGRFSSSTTVIVDTTVHREQSENVTTVTDPNKLLWINEIISQLFPSLSETAASVVKEDIEPMIQNRLCYSDSSPLSLLFSWIGFKMNAFDMGSIPPRITRIAIHKANVIHQELVIDCDLIYDGDMKFEIQYGLRIGCQNVKINAKLRFVIKPLLNEIPIIGGIRLSFLETPTLDYDLTGLVGDLLEKVPGLLSSTLNEIFRTQAQRYVFPKTFDISFLPHMIDDHLTRNRLIPEVL